VTLDPNLIAKLFRVYAHTAIIAPTRAGDYYQKIGIPYWFPKKMDKLSNGILSRLYFPKVLQLPTLAEF
jgi:hypothetical protein